MTDSRLSSTTNSRVSDESSWVNEPKKKMSGQSEAASLQFQDQEQRQKSSSSSSPERGISENDHHPYEGCTEVFVGAGWGGIYSFYRRVLDGVLIHHHSGTQYCLMEQASRIGGRTYSIPVAHRLTGAPNFVLDLGAYRFTPDMHLVGDLILNQLKLPTECYEPNCPTPVQDDFPSRRKRRRLDAFNYHAPFRRIVDPITGLPGGYVTALDQMVEKCKSLGARVFLDTKLVELQVEREEHKTLITFENTVTRIRASLSSDEDNLNVVMLNLPRNHLFNVQGVKSSLEPNIAKTLECIVFDAPEDLFGKEAVQIIEENQKYVSTFGKAYLYYEDAWWRTKLNKTEGEWPPNADSIGAMKTPQGVLLNVRWHDGPVQCYQQQTGLSLSSAPFPTQCRGFLEVYYSISNETFYSSLPAATDDVIDDEHTKPTSMMVDPLGMVWLADSPHAQEELGLAHAALMESLAPLWNTTPELIQARRSVQPPVGMVVGIWQRPNRYSPLGMGWTNPTKVYYEPSMSGPPDVACGVPGLTDETYRQSVLQPFDFINPSSLHSSIDYGTPSSPTRIFLVNNDFVCSNIRSSFGDWAEESLMQAERALFELGTPKPSWLQELYYQQHIVDQQHITIHSPTIMATTYTSPGMSPGSLWALVVVVLVAFAAFCFDLFHRRSKTSDVAIILEVSERSMQHPQWEAERITILKTTKDGQPLSHFGDVDSTELKRTEHGTGTDCNEGEGDDNDEDDVDNDGSVDHTKEKMNLWARENLAIPVSYCVCGIAGGMFRTFMNVYPIDIGATEAQQTTFITLSALPAAFKILFGFTSDTNPIFGYRRKPYLFLGWLLSSLAMLSLFLTSDLHLERQQRTDLLDVDLHKQQQKHYHHSRDIVIVPDNAPTLSQLGWSFFLFGFGMWFANAMTDAWVAEKAKHESDAVKGSLQSTCYVVRFFGLMVSAPISTYLYSKVGPQVIVLGMVCIPMFVLPLIWWLSETQVHVKPVREQCQEIWNTVCLRSVWEPMAFLYLFNLLQVSNSAWRQFLVTVLGFTPANLNTLLVFSYALVYLGTMLYKYCLLHTSWRLIYQVCIVLNLLFSSLQLLLIRGHTFGVSPFLFALFDDAIGEFLSGIQFLPAIVMMVSLCPTGSEGVSYAMFTTVMNSSWMIANVISSLMLGIWDVRKETLDSGRLDGMFKLSLLTTIVQFTPLLFIYWLPHGRKELEQLSMLPFSGSPLGGGIFLTVLFMSMGITLLVSILNITKPGWAGES